jgi:hypothetical protein
VRLESEPQRVESTVSERDGCMQRLLLRIILSAFVGVPVGYTDPASNGVSDPQRATRLFASLAGHWSCSGAFADGRPLSSDITITLRADGRAVEYQHRDRPPTDFVQDALWGPDPQNKQLVSVALPGMPKCSRHNCLSLRSGRSDRWSL